MLKQSSVDTIVFHNVAQDPGVTAAQLAERIQKAFPHDGDPIYGYYKQVSLSIAGFRKRGVFKDVERCEYCRRPARSHKPVPLFLNQ